MKFFVQKMIYLNRITIVHPGGWQWLPWALLPAPWITVAAHGIAVTAHRISVPAHGTAPALLSHSATVHVLDGI